MHIFLARAVISGKGSAPPDPLHEVPEDAQRKQVREIRDWVVAEFENFA